MEPTPPSSELASQLDQLSQLAATAFEQIQHSYTSQHPPLHTLLRLREQLRAFHAQLRTSGLGALPRTPPTPTSTDHQLQQDFQALYHQRQNQRQAAAIVLAVIPQTQESQ